MPLCATGYADLPSNERLEQEGLFRALLDCRIVLRTLRSLGALLGFSAPEQLGEISLDYGAYVHLFGGFSGTERSRSERNPAANPTILDGSSAGTVLTSVGAGFGVSTVDGFTLQHGVKVTETLTGDAMGGGILCQVSSPIIANNRIIENSVGHPNLSDHAHGGGIACYLSYARIANFSRYINADVDAWLDEAGTITDTAARKDLYCNVVKQVNADLPRIYLYERLSIMGHRNEFQGLKISPTFVDFAWDAANWTLEQ